MMERIGCQLSGNVVGRVINVKRLVRGMYDGNVC